MNLAQLLDLLGQWAARGWLRELDRAFAAFLVEQAADAEPLLVLAAALASHQLGRGHVCLDLAATLADSRFALSLPPDGELGEAALTLPGELLDGLDLAAWQAALDDPRLVGDGPGATPLVLAGQRLYLRRYWQYERAVRAGIELRLARAAELRAALPEAALRHALDSLFPARAGAPSDWQKLACALVAGNAFGIVTGGPGTGKTTTVVKLLALLQSLAVEGAAARPLRIRLAAPTGKAAARLNESIAGAVQGLKLDGLPAGEALRALIPTEVTTLHRLLGSRPDSRQFRHHAGNPLALDLLVVDEASMVDLEMMAALLAALPDKARLILLGDKDQLASVEAGAVLGELCSRARDGHYHGSTRDWLQAVTGEPIDETLLDADGLALDQAVAMLRHSHRFSAQSGIGRLAEAVNAGDLAATRAVWQHGYADLARLSLEAGDNRALRELVVEGGGRNFPGQGGGREGIDPPQGYRHYLSVLRDGQPALSAPPAAFDAWALRVLAAHGRFQVLCALRRGPWGVEGLNLRIAELLESEGLIQPGQAWYLGRPLLVTRNDYGLGLMNGDIGLTLALPREQDGERHWALRVAFADGQGGIKWVLPSRLQAVETVYAMTVHKSQGSEFTHAALVLPDALNPILTRELVYTGITRARHWFSLASAGRGPWVLEAAIERRVLRASGLLDARD
ncbi:exodeoxyribonuclease V subunit alpha [Pseudomonas panipatensis]|uniref:RecBCD enzyme subunit RecD n=1 Tax=Pseudomonas panipatensis TaxID=428992 RepID=A0A1G8KNJ9_9PSED|nr:exodeoxyribonuclease V subunit alpha [Pseudomonas panipatensis]SDI44480.1 DNA helicase/exodeoxyribonuclease V, alpha subunit [Pseudomonas panipatensis]SMP70074.1 DNA helicase/exodeoxyribonuclease V, alpha subunit [Pseudomonas panipatensis]